MTLRKKWLAERKASFNKISNTIWIYDWRVYYQISIGHVDAEPLILD